MPTLTRLRSKRSEFDRQFALMAERHDGEAKPRTASPEIAERVAALRLAPGPAHTLTADAQLITDWYSMPGRRKSLSMGQDHLMAELAEIGTLAVTTQHYLAPNAIVIEELIASIEPPLSRPIQRLDLQRLADELHVLGRATKLLRQRLVKAGAKGHARRDHAMAMLTQAVEAATGVRVTTSRENRNNPDPHFTNEGGLFVFEIMRLLGWTGQPALVRAFERMRRQPRPAQK